MDRKHRFGYSWLAVALCMALLMTGLPFAPAYAKSKKDKYYTIKWKVNGETIKKEKVKKGEMPEIPEDPGEITKDGVTYVFKEWEPKVTKAKENVTYKARFKKKSGKTVTITWLDDEGALIDFTQVKVGKVPKHEDPKKKASKKYTYVFDGWEPKLQKATEDTTYTATFQKKARKYKITWLDDKGNVIDQTKVAYGKLPEHDDPVKKSKKYNYTFTGWQPAITEVTGEATYTATFEKGEAKGEASADTYTITWLDDEGNLIDTTTVKAGKKPKHDAPTKAATDECDYQFAGWEPKVVKATADATYTATFEKVPHKFTVTWLDDEGNVIDQTQVSYGEVPTHDAPTMPDSETHSYVFRSWDPEPVAATGDATYTAVFDEIPKEAPAEEAPVKETQGAFTVTWLDDMGNPIDTTLVAYGDMPVHDDPVKPDADGVSYTFAGWSPELAPVTGDATYTATFAETAVGELPPETEHADMAQGNSVKVLFKYADDDSLIDFPQEYIEQTDPQQVWYKGATPVKAATETAAYEWIGWTDDKTKPTEAKYDKSIEGAARDEKLQLLPMITVDSPAETVYYAVFKEIAPKEYTITWKMDASTVIDTTKVLQGQKPTHADPVKAGSVFDGWVPEGSDKPVATANLPEATADATYTAHFTAQIKPVELADACYAFVKDTNDREALKNLLPATAKLDDGREVNLDWSNAALEYEDAKSGVKNDGVYTYTVNMPDPNDASITLAVSCRIVVGPKKSEKVGSVDNDKYEYRWDSIVKDANTKAIITAWNGSDKELAVPSAIDGMTVTAINDGVFQKKDLTSVTVLAGVTAIGTSAFADCANLTSLTLPDSLTSVGMNLIDNCPKLENMMLAVALKTTMAKDSSGCYTITHVVDETDPSKPVMSQTVTLPAGMPTDMVIAAGGVLTMKADLTIYNGHHATGITAETYKSDGGKLLAEINWHDDAGNPVEEEPTTYVEYLQTPSHAEPPKDPTTTHTYTFDKWTPDIVAVSDPAPYTASFKEAERLYTITFVDEDGTTRIEDPKQWKYNEVPKCSKTPTKAAELKYNYTFDGWEGSDGKLHAADKLPGVTADATYKAHYKKEDRKPVQLEVTYIGTKPLTKVYDCTPNAVSKTTSGQYVFHLNEWKEFKSTADILKQYRLNLSDGSKMVTGHTDVRLHLSIPSPQLTSKDVGDREFKVIASLAGDDKDWYTLKETEISVPVKITQREVVITPRAKLSKVYGTKDPVYPQNSWLIKDTSSPLHQDLSGQPGYAAPVKQEEGKSPELTLTSQTYLLKEAQMNGTKFFPNDGWLSRESGEDVGTYKITIGKMNFGSNFKMTLNSEVFTITAKPLSDANITVDAIGKQTYTGKAIELDEKTLVVRYGTMTLKKDTDYTVKYENNTETGTAKVTLTGKGNYTGTREVTFTIIKTSGGGSSGGGSSGGGSSSSGYGYDGFDDEEEDAIDDSEENKNWTKTDSGNFIIEDVDYGTIQYTTVGEARTFYYYVEEYVTESIETGEIQLRRLVIRPEPMKTINEQGEEEEALLEGTTRKRYEDTHLRLTNETVQNLVANGYGEIVYEVEQAALRIPLSSLTGEIVISDAGDDEGEIVELDESDGDFDVEEEIEIEGDEEEFVELEEDADSEEEIDLEEEIDSEEEDTPIDLQENVETRPVDGYDFVIEQADATGFSQREQALLDEYQTLLPAYRVHISIIPQGAEQVATGALDENGEPIVVPTLEELPEGCTLTDVALLLQPDEHFATAPLEAQVLYASKALQAEDESLDAAEDDESLDATEEDFDAEDESAGSTDDDVEFEDDSIEVADEDIESGTDDNVEEVYDPIAEGDAELIPAEFDEENSPMKAVVEPVVDGMYTVVAPLDWDPTPYLNTTTEVSEPDDSVEIEEEIETDDEELEIEEEDDEELVEF